MVESNNPIKAIGGYFELADRDCTAGFMPVAGVALNTCRNALEYILLQLKDAKRIYLPYYTCEAVVEPLKRLPVAYEFYPINEQLEIAVEPVLEKGDYLIANNYFGIKDAYITQLAEKYGDQLIVDNAQALFASVPAGIKAAYSTRKFVGVADGGFAVGVAAEPALQLPVDNTSGRNSHLYIRKEKGAEAGFRDYQANECKLDNQPIRRMAPETQTILSGIDYRSIVAKRRQNYQYLSSALDAKNLLRLPSRDTYACPMVYPFMTENETLRAKLIEHKIFVARYWPNVQEWTNADSTAYRLATHVIPLPIDQRYDEQDMQRIIDLIAGN